jgi:tRNA A-37 threonylcarbamoyl transferase component Bud32/tetratricopeptide (TPR) repeat protein
MGCLDEQTVFAFVSGALAGQRLAETERHLLGCADCASLVALAAPTTIAGRTNTIEWLGGPPPEERPPAGKAAAGAAGAGTQATVGGVTEVIAGSGTQSWLPEPDDSFGSGDYAGAASDQLRPGAVVGRYRLLQLVGRGGMGEVYAAHDPELDRKIAIKIMRANAVPDGVEAARLMREARTIARLSHPNLVTVYDVGTAAGRVFVAMELIEGDTVAAWLDQKRRPRDEILRVFGLAGRGLAAAHRAGIIHRDFKPQNVMVTADGAVRVMDFGLAAIRQTLLGPNAPRLTRIGSILGTPLYMSPEQLCGQPVDPRADQFSFCVALYEALYGERPFKGDNFAQLRAAVLEGQPRPAPPSSRVPARVRAILLRGLSVVPGRRFPDMEALLKALDQVTAKRVGLPLMVGVGVAAGAVAFAAAFGVAWQLRGARPSSKCATPPSNLTAAWPTTGDTPRRAQVRNAFLAANVPDARERYERVSQALDAYATSWAGMYRQVCENEASGGAAPEAAAVAQRTGCLDQRVASLGALVDELAHADAKVVRRAVAATLALPPLDSCADARSIKAMAAPADEALRTRVQTLRSRLAALWAMAAAGQDWPALKPVGTLVDEIRTAGHEPLLAEALIVYARIRSPFDPEGAEPIYEEAFKRGEALHNDELAAEAAIQLIAIAGAVGHHFDRGDRWAHVAEATVERGVPLRVRGSFLHNRGTLNAARGSWRLAEADFAAAVAIRQQALGAVHPDLAASMVRLAKTVLVLGDARRAHETAGRALSVSGAFFPAESYEVGAARLVRGQALLALERIAEARPDLEAVRDIFERVLGRDHPFLADPMAALGEIALAQGRSADAQALLERAWEIRSTHTADGGVREQTAFSLARAIWDAAPAERKHALDLASEARDGYSGIPDLAARLNVIDGWLAARHPRTVVRPSAPARPAPRQATQPEQREEKQEQQKPEDLEPAPL